MRRPTEPCPGCESPRKFPLRFRPHAGSDVVIEVYISCTSCLFEQTLRLSTREIERLKVLMAKISAQASKQKAKHGVVSSRTFNSMNRAADLLSEAEKKLDEELARCAS